MTWVTIVGDALHGVGASRASGYAALTGRPIYRRRVVATPNYSYEKRQRELAKKRKQEEKRQKKANPRPDGEADSPAPDEGAAQGGVQPAPEPGR